VCQQGENGESMFLIIDGRVRVTVAGPEGEMPVKYLGPGEHFGEISLLAAGPRTASVTAVTDAELLELSRESFYPLTSAVPLLAANLCRWMGGWMRREIGGQRRPPRAAVVALVRTTPRTATLAAQVVGALPPRAAARVVLTDRPGDWPVGPNLFPLPAVENGAAAGEVRRLHAQLVAAGGQLLIDVAPAGLAPLLQMECDEIWWLAETSAYDDARLRDACKRDPDLAARIRVILLLPSTVPVTKSTVPTGEWATIRVCADEPEGRLRPADLVRLVRRVQGVQAGLALSGGGAWGMAHLGVLRAFERAGVFFDRVAGTSIGGVIAAGHAAGYPPADLLHHMPQEMTPPAWLRRLPGGRRWFLLLYMRLGWNARCFRRYLHDLTFADLLLPTHVMAVDLIRGREVVQSEGNVVNALVASSALPGFARPVLRDGQALLDGGILNNLPVDVLRRNGAQFVVAVDVATGLSPELGGNCATTPTDQMKSVGLRETLLRILEVQLANLKVSRAASADVVVAPDTVPYYFDDFGAAESLAECGERAAEQQLPEIRRGLEDLGAGA
jgi:predicted acylesterase/phospholipase RssA